MPSFQNCKACLSDKCMSKRFEPLFKSLVGCWLLERKISSGERLIGKAVFEPVSDTVFLLCEEGELSLLNGSKVHASRKWYWHLDVNNVLEITYDARRAEPYHRISLVLKDDLWQGQADHLCGADCYQGLYRFCKNEFGVDQTIKGPAKNYTVQSLYSKMAVGVPEYLPREP